MILILSVIITVAVTVVGSIDDGRANERDRKGGVTQEEF